MKRIIGVTGVALAAVAAFGGLVYGVLMAAHVAEPAVTTVHGLTPQRLWATTSALVAVVGVVTGALAVAGRRGPVVALAAGFIAAVSGGLNLAVANGGPGTGNGVVGGAAAFVLGLTALTLGAVAQVRLRRTAPESGQTT